MSLPDSNDVEDPPEPDYKDDNENVCDHEANEEAEAVDEPADEPEDEPEDEDEAAVMAQMGFSAFGAQKPAKKKQRLSPTATGTAAWAGVGTGGNALPLGAGRRMKGVGVGGGGGVGGGAAGGGASDAAAATTSIMTTTLSSNLSITTTMMPNTSLPPRPPNNDNPAHDPALFHHPHNLPPEQHHLPHTAKSEGSDTAGLRPDNTWDLSLLRRGVLVPGWGLGYYDKGFVEDPWERLRRARGGVLALNEGEDGRA